MRVLIVVSVALILVAGCATVEPPRPGGCYAIVVDPELEAQRARGGVLLHEQVRQSLAERLDLVHVDMADAVIVLKKAPTQLEFRYEIRRRGGAVAADSTLPALAMLAADPRSVGDQLEQQRRDEYARGDRTIQYRRDLIPRSSSESGSAVSIVFRAGNLIAQRIIEDLGGM